MEKQLPISVWPEWKIIEKIGEGSFGKVYKAQRIVQGKTFYSAIKVITIPSSQGELSSVRSENPDEQSVKEYFHSLVEDCIQEVSTMEYFRGNSHVVSVEDYKVVEYLDDIELSEFKELPTYKRFCLCILKNDHICKYMGFSASKVEQERREQIMKKYYKLFCNERVSKPGI